MVPGLRDDATAGHCPAGRRRGSGHRRPLACSWQHPGSQRRRACAGVQPGEYLLDPNPAVTRAGLVAELARELGAWQIDPMIAFLSVERPVSTPFARTLRILESMPWHEREVARKLRELGVGSADIRRRGLRRRRAADPPPPGPAGRKKRDDRPHAPERPALGPHLRAGPGSSTTLKPRRRPHRSLAPGAAT